MTEILAKLINNFSLAIVFKIAVLIVLILYSFYVFLLMSQVKSLSHIVNIHAKNASKVLYFFAVLYLILSISLFITALVIL